MDMSPPPSPSVQSGTGDDASLVRTAAPSAVTPRFASCELLRGHRLAVIVHEGAEYRLQLTRQNRLLLTK